jgi:hypothetical protein
MASPANNEAPCCAATAAAVFYPAPKRRISCLQRRPGRRVVQRMADRATRGGGSSGGLVDRLAGGWTLGTILTIDSGFPFQLYGGYLTYNDYGDGGLVLNGTAVSQLQKAVGVFTAPGKGTYKYAIDPALLTQSATSACSSILQDVCQNITPGGNRAQL